jgi:hypothetical protein
MLVYNDIKSICALKFAEHEFRFYCERTDNNTVAISMHATTFSRLTGMVRRENIPASTNFRPIVDEMLLECYQKTVRFVADAARKGCTCS